MLVEVSEAEDTYATGQAARILKVTDRGVRKMIDRGELERERTRSEAEIVAVIGAIAPRAFDPGPASPNADKGG